MFDTAFAQMSVRGGEARIRVRGDPRGSEVKPRRGRILQVKKPGGRGERGGKKKVLDFAKGGREF